MKKLRLYDLLNRFSEFLASDSFDSSVRFLRHSDVLNWFSNETSIPPETILADLDECWNDHLPDTLKSALPLASRSMIPILDQILKYKEMWSAMSPSQSVRSLFSLLYGSSKNPESSGIPLSDELDALEPFLLILEKSPLFAGESIDEALSELLEVCGNIRLYRKSQENDFSVSGFLELPWSDAKRIILCGMNEDFIPENVAGNPFLSDSMRMKLGLQNNARRKGRDTLYLESLLNSRAPGNMRFLAARTDPSGKPLKYSSLLFQGSDQELFDRASVLFDKVRFPERKAENREDAGFILSPDYSIVPDPENIILSVTEFRSYLESPFRFFLKKFMKMSSSEYAPVELDRASFGTVCHRAIEHTARTSDPAEMKRRILESLENQMTRTYGLPLPVLPEIQMEQMKQRLIHAAESLAESASEFTVLETEYQLGGDRGYLELEGGKIRGRIDCIEYSREQNLLRLIDFKTSDKGDPPEKTHLTANRFHDLQLPLYRILIERDAAFHDRHPEIDFSNLRILCGYFNLPKNVMDTGYVFWNNMDDHLPSVRQLVHEIFEEIPKMREGIFFREAGAAIKYDDFDFCLQRELRKSVPSAEFYQGSISENE